jgi:hypothetical protein
MRLSSVSSKKASAPCQSPIVADVSWAAWPARSRASCRSAHLCCGTGSSACLFARRCRNGGQASSKHGRFRATRAVAKGETRLLRWKLPPTGMTRRFAAPIDDAPALRVDLLHTHPSTPADSQHRTCLDLQGLNVEEQS